MKIIIPRYKCIKCKKVFKRNCSGCIYCGDFDGFCPGPIRCIYCGNIYVEWLNWEQVIKSLGDYGRA
jgi:hypothetical protein